MLGTVSISMTIVLLHVLCSRVNKIAYIASRFAMWTIYYFILKIVNEKYYDE